MRAVRREDKCVCFNPVGKNFHIVYRPPSRCSSPTDPALDSHLKGHKCLAVNTRVWPLISCHCQCVEKTIKVFLTFFSYLVRGVRPFFFFVTDLSVVPKFYVWMVSFTRTVKDLCHQGNTKVESVFFLQISLFLILSGKNIYISIQHCPLLLVFLANTENFNKSIQILLTCSTFITCVTLLVVVIFYNLFVIPSPQLI